MRVTVAKKAGFCFGVRRAVDAAESAAKEHGVVYCLGELIHNSLVTDKLREKGVVFISEPEEAPEGALVLIRSHGEPPETYERLHHATVLDLTCPIVRRIHEKVYESRNKFDLTIIIGEARHPEVAATLGWAGSGARVVETEQDVLLLPRAGSALVVSQTTITRERFESLCELIKQRFRSTEIFGGICDATANMQREAAALAEESDAVIVLGGKNSSNTQKLFAVVKNKCKNVKYIERTDELFLDYFRPHGIIGIVAGASTPDWLIREVYILMSELENIQAAGELGASEATTEATDVICNATECATEAVETAVEGDAATEAVEQPAEAAAEVEETVDDGMAEFGNVIAAPKPIDENADFLAEMEKTFKSIKKGQLVEGIVVLVSDDEVCVNIGYKSDGIIKKEDLTAEGNVSPADMFKPGDVVTAEIVMVNDGVGNVRLSRKKIESQLKWKKLVEELDTTQTFNCMVTKVIKGGVLSKLDGYEAFIPASQLSLKYVEDLGQFVGQTLPVKIIEVDKHQKRFVLSHKSILIEQEEENKKELFRNFVKGSTIHGTVKRLTDFGAFVDVGGVDGLLHITDISWVRPKHPSEVLEVGQQIDVKVLNVDPEKKKILLGLKQLQARPWDLAPEKYIVGSDVEGKVVRIAPFGAFIQLEPTVDGLVHISQVADRRIEKVEDALTVGETIKARVLEVNPEKKRISLSIRAIINEQKANDRATQRAEEKVQKEQQTFTERPERTERTERPARTERPRSDRNDRFDRGDRADRGDRGERVVIPAVQTVGTSLGDLFPKELLGDNSDED